MRTHEFVQSNECEGFRTKKEATAWKREFLKGPAPLVPMDNEAHDRPGGILQDIEVMGDGHREWESRWEMIGIRAKGEIPQERGE